MFALLFAIVASFDCGKATTKVEKTICADARLASLDVELARTYKEASAHIDLKESQREWLKTRDAEDDKDVITAAYLARIEDIRLKANLFARESPPASIFGRFTETQPLCLIIEGTNDYDCDHNGDAESFIDIRRGEGNQVKVESTLVFFNGHECSFSGPAEWSGGALRVPQFRDTEGKCVLLLHFDKDRVTTEDVSNVCRSYLCGMRGGFAHISLPKKKPLKRSRDR
jgi:uncharacterized protein